MRTLWSTARMSRARRPRPKSGDTGSRLKLFLTEQIRMVEIALSSSFRLVRIAPVSENLQNEPYESLAVLSSEEECKRSRHTDDEQRRETPLTARRVGFERAQKAGHPFLYELRITERCRTSWLPRRNQSDRADDRLGEVRPRHTDRSCLFVARKLQRPPPASQACCGCRSGPEEVGCQLS